MGQLGYWASPGSTVFYQCDIPSACLPGANGSRSSCAEGYAGVVCGVCAGEFFEQFGRCGGRHLKWAALLAATPPPAAVSTAWVLACGVNTAAAATAAVVLGAVPPGVWRARRTLGPR